MDNLDKVGMTVELKKGLSIQETLVLHSLITGALASKMDLELGRS